MSSIKEEILKELTEVSESKSVWSIEDFASKLESIFKRHIEEAFDKGANAGFHSIPGMKGYQEQYKKLKSEYLKSKGITE